MIAFSVPMTDASSRYTRVPLRPLAERPVDAVELYLGAQRREGVDMGVQAPSSGSRLRPEEAP